VQILVPITGELITFDSGNPDNPVRPINLTKLLPSELADFSSEAIRYDFEAGVVELEITFTQQSIPIEWDAGGKIIKLRTETVEELEERQTRSEAALRKVLRDHTVSELHQMTGEAKLIRPFKE